MTLRRLTLSGAIAALCLAALAFGVDEPVLCYGASALILAIAAIGARGAPMGIIAGAGVGCLAVISLGQLFAVDRAAAGPDLAALLAAAGLIQLARALTIEKNVAREAVTATLLGALVMSVVAFVDFAAAPDHLFGQPKAFHGDRLTAGFLSANTAATFFAMMSTLALGAGIADRQRHQGRWGAWLITAGRLPGLAFVFGLTCLLLTGSRAGIAAGAAGILVVLITQLKGPGRWRYVLAAAAGFVGLALVSRGVLIDRLVTVGVDGSGRGALWSVSWQAFLARPFLGHGLGSFPEAIMPFITPPHAPSLVMQGAAHNVVLQWLVQTGLVGTLAALGFVAVVARRAVQGLRRRRRARPLMVGLLAALAVAAGHGLVDYALEIPGLMFWVAWLAGLVLGLAEGSSARQDRRSRDR